MGGIMKRSLAIALSLAISLGLFTSLTACSQSGQSPNKNKADAGEVAKVIAEAQKNE